VSKYSIEKVTWDVELKFEFEGNPVTLFGGVPIEPKAIKKYYKDYLNVSDEILDQTLKAMQAPYEKKGDGTEELEEKNEAGVYGFRRDEEGPYIRDFMVKACVFHAASTAHFTKKIKFLKNQLKEGLVILPAKIRFYRNNKVLVRPDELFRVQGRVSSPAGFRQIVTWKEAIHNAPTIKFKIRYLDTGIIVPELLKSIMEVAEQVGIGSLKSQDAGKFTVKVLKKTA
jgi:hypothetical protein